MKSILLLSGLLFANTSVGLPAPYAFSEAYSSIEAGELQSEVINEKNYYKSEIKNTGNNYIDISGCYLNNNNSKNEAISAYSEVIAPGKSKVVYFEDKSDSQVFSKNDIKVNAYADAVRDLVSFKSFGQKTVETKASKNYFNEDKTIYQYFIEVNYEINQSFESYYSLMFTVNYNGEDHSYYQYDFNKDENPYRLRFKSEENLDLNSIEVKDVFLLKGNSYYEEFIKKDNNDAIKKGLLGGGLALLLVGLILGVIFILRKVFSQRHA